MLVALRFAAEIEAIYRGLADGRLVGVNHPRVRFRLPRTFLIGRRSSGFGRVSLSAQGMSLVVRLALDGDFPGVQHVFNTTRRTGSHKQRGLLGARDSARSRAAHATNCSRRTAVSAPSGAEPQPKSRSRRSKSWCGLVSSSVPHVIRQASPYSSIN